MGFDRKKPHKIVDFHNSREIGELREAVRALPEVRWERVAAIRQAIESGTYVVDPAKIARKMIDEAL